MLSLTNWVYVIKTLLRSELTASEIREAILNDCLFTSDLFWGEYQVDGEKVYKMIICKDANCRKRCEELRISNVFEVLSYYEQVKYKQMRGTYPGKRSRR